MANNRFNQQIQTVKETQSGGKGVMPLKGTAQPSSLNMSVANWPGLPGKAGPDRAQGMPEEKIYAQAKGIRGGTDGDDGATSKDF